MNLDSEIHFVRILRENRKKQSFGDADEIRWCQGSCFCALVLCICPMFQTLESFVFNTCFFVFFCEALIGCFEYLIDRWRQSSYLHQYCSSVNTVCQKFQSLRIIGWLFGPRESFLSKLLQFLTDCNKKFIHDQNQAQMFMTHIICSAIHTLQSYMPLDLHACH